MLVRKKILSIIKNLEVVSSILLIGYIIFFIFSDVYYSMDEANKTIFNNFFGVVIVYFCFTTMYYISLNIRDKESMRKLKKMSNFAQDIANTNFKTTLEIVDSSELGKLAELLINMRDGISELLNQEYQLMKNLELSNEAKSKFIANMSHEFRTPLNSIIGFSEIFNPVQTRQVYFGKLGLLFLNLTIGGAFLGITSHLSRRTIIKSDPGHWVIKRYSLMRNAGIMLVLHSLFGNITPNPVTNENAIYAIISAVGAIGCNLVAAFLFYMAWVKVYSQKSTKAMEKEKIREISNTTLPTEELLQGGISQKNHQEQVISSESSPEVSKPVQNIVDFFGSQLALLIGKNPIVARGIIRFAIMDEIMDNSTITSTQLRHVLTEILEKKLKNINIEDTKPIIEEMMKNLAQNYSIITMSQV